MLTRKEVLADLRTVGGRNTRRYYGLHYKKENLIFLNIRKATNRKDLRNTIAHELLHARFPYLGHGSKFYGMLKMVLKGKRYPPYKPKEKK